MGCLIMGRGALITGRGGVSPPRAKCRNMPTVWKSYIGRGDLAPTHWVWNSYIGRGDLAPTHWVWNSYIGRGDPAPTVMKYNSVIYETFVVGRHLVSQRC